MMFSRLESLAQHRLDDRPGHVSPQPKKRQLAGKPAPNRTPMRMALAHLVQNPALAADAPGLGAFDGCDLPGFEIYRDLVDFCAKRPNMTTAQLLELWHDNPAQSHLEKLATWSLPGEDDRLLQEFRDAVTGMELQWTESMIAGMPKFSELGPEERKELLALQRRRQELIGALQGDDR
jgi:DNA primase